MDFYPEMCQPILARGNHQNFFFLRVWTQHSSPCPSFGRYQCLYVRHLDPHIEQHSSSLSVYLGILGIFYPTIQLDNQVFWDLDLHLGHKMSLEKISRTRLWSLFPPGRAPVHQCHTSLKVAYALWILKYRNILSWQLRSSKT